MKQKIKGKIRFVIYIAGFFFKKNFCYEVFTKQKKNERGSNYYLGGVNVDVRVSLSASVPSYTRSRFRADPHCVDCGGGLGRTNGAARVAAVIAPAEAAPRARCTGFQQCQSFVEMGTVRCCPLGTVPCGLCPGCWCGGLYHQSTQTLADSDRWTPSSSSGSSSCLSRPALRADGGGLVGLG